MLIESMRGGINLRLPAWKKEFAEKEQCLYMRNLRYKSDFFDSIPGTKKYHSTTLGANPITALMPYYNDQTDQFSLLAATGSKIVRRNPATNEFETLLDGLTLNSIFSSTIRYDVMYIPSVKDGLKKYLGGTKVETVGGGITAPGSFRQVLYAKEVDRLFGISDDAIFGQISWCDFGQPEIWDGANVERFKLKDGERVEGAEILYGKIIVFCTYSIWIYYISGNEENWRLEEAPTVIGCVAPNTIKKTGSLILYLGEAPRHQLGVYEFNGSTSRLLTDDVYPLFQGINKNKKRNACAEVHDDLYTLSFSTGYSETNNISIDLDLLNSKEDRTPAIYGPHTIAFYSSCVLNGRQNNKEFLMGDEADGFVYVEGGTTLKSVNGIDGQLLEQRFISRIHNDKSFEMVKRYGLLQVMFRPRGYYDALIRYYLSTSRFPIDHTFNPYSNDVDFGGEFNVYEQPFYGTPQLYQFQEFLEASAVGTSIQIEISNFQVGKRLAFDAYGYTKTDLHPSKKVQTYA